MSRHLIRPPRAPVWHAGISEWPISWWELLAARKAVAAARRGALSLRCAALHHGWAVLEEPLATELALPPGRKARLARREHGLLVEIRRTLTPREWADRVTSPLRTVLDCSAALPFQEALAIADSALRAGDVGALELIEAAERATRRRTEALRVARAASGLADNPFESALRALVLDVQGAAFVPQLSVRTEEGLARVDLGEPKLRIAVEADSYLSQAVLARIQATVWGRSTRR